jgi:ABC-type siderophore export system fused ATPase/permease subunit
MRTPVTARIIKLLAAMGVAHDFIDTLIVNCLILLVCKIASLFCPTIIGQKICMQLRMGASERVISNIIAKQTEVLTGSGYTSIPECPDSSELNGN